MERCPRCGKKPHPEDLYCGYCGFNIQVKESEIGETQEAFKLSDIQLRLGIVHLKKKEYYKAIEKFEKTLQYDPENKQAQAYLIQSKEALRQTKENL
jgi:Tfp pilus assembly protein PilF